MLHQPDIASRSRHRYQNRNITKSYSAGMAPAGLIVGQTPARLRWMLESSHSKCGRRARCWSRRRSIPSSRASNVVRHGMSSSRSLVAWNGEHRRHTRRMRIVRTGRPKIKYNDSNGSSSSLEGWSYALEGRRGGTTGVPTVRCPARHGEYDSVMPVSIILRRHLGLMVMPFRPAWRGR